MFSKNRSHLLAVCNSVAEQFCPRLRPAAALSRADRRKYQLQRRRCYSSAAGKGILVQSDYGTVAVPQLNVSQFIWKDYEKWGDKPMVVRIAFSFHCDESASSCISRPFHPSDPIPIPFDSPPRCSLFANDQLACTRNGVRRSYLCSLKINVRG